MFILWFVLALALFLVIPFVSASLGSVGVVVMCACVVASIFMGVRAVVKRIKGASVRRKAAIDKHDEPAPEPAPVANVVPPVQEPAPIANVVPPVQEPVPVAKTVPPVQQPAPVAKSIGNVKKAALKRPFKGESLFDIPDDYVVVDIETTGLDPSRDGIIEVSALRVRAGVAEDSYSKLVNPGFEIDEFITKLTGITNEMLAPEPDISTVLPSLLAFVGDDIVVGHNVNFDVNFIYTASESSLGKPFVNDFIDTVRLARAVFTDCTCYRLGYLCKKLSLPVESTHRAMDDVLATNELYKYICNYVRSSGSDIYALRKARVKEKLALNADSAKINVSSPLYNKVCVFTGVLERYTRKSAIQAVTNIGGICADNVTKKTNFLILGNNDYCQAIKDGKSAKQKKAEQYVLSGCDIEIISEDVFYEIIAQCEKECKAEEVLA